MKLIGVLYIIETTLICCSCIKEKCNYCKNSEFQQYRILFTGEGIKTKSPPVLRFEEGIGFAVFGFSEDENPKTRPTWPGTPFNAISDIHGNLIQLSDDKLIVPKGIYDFYAVSCNKVSVLLPCFNQGWSQPLENCIDYIWASCKNVPVDKDIVVPMQFHHKCAAVRVEIDYDRKNNPFVIKNISMTTPSESNDIRMSLNDGSIASAQSLSQEYSYMTMNNNIGEIIILPLESGLNPQIMIEIYCSGCAKDVLLKTTLPSFEKGFQSGKRYTYYLSASNNNLQTGQTSIHDWEYQDISNIDVK